MRSLWITLTLGLTVFLSGETVSFLRGTRVGLEAAEGPLSRAGFTAARARF